MGASKRLLEEQQEKLERAVSMLISHGAAKTCENHGYAIDAEDGEAADSVKEELANEMTASEAEELVDNAMANLYWECPGCVSNMKG